MTPVLGSPKDTNIIALRLFTHILLFPQFILVTCIDLVPLLDYLKVEASNVPPGTFEGLTILLVCPGCHNKIL